MPSFLYHKSIVGFDFVMCLFMIPEMCMELKGPVAWNPAMDIATDVHACIENICGMTVEWLAMVVSLERIVAMFLPLKFHRINTDQVATCGIVFSFLVGFSHYCTRAFHKFLKGGEVYDNFRLYLANIQMVQCFSLAVFSFLIVVGIFKQMKSSTRAQLDVDSKAAASISLQISLLSLSLSIPPFIETLLYQISQNMCANNACLYGPAAVTDPLITYAEAVTRLERKNANYMWMFMSYIWWGIAHSDHFYVYAILSPKFRDAVVTRFGLHFMVGKVRPSNFSSKGKPITL